ncbi:TPA: hypothetical protein I8273_004545 [Aeromonas hydrophila]|nr:hypothetical protein [Aeromonas hydrophila]HAT2639008.1 hypothetical protein [Aeromonas hydrophila]HAT3424130.1 hypothetical protein [Aeromonas hydrophila]HAT3534169.1 hypothetical protein [Aeromonas hydrophila]
MTEKTDKQGVEDGSPREHLQFKWRNLLGAVLTAGLLGAPLGSAISEITGSAGFSLFVISALSLFIGNLGWCIFGRVK